MDYTCQEKSGFCNISYAFFKERPYNYDLSVISNGLQKPVHKLLLALGNFFDRGPAAI